MTHTQYDLASRRLLTKLKAELEEVEHGKRDLPRAPAYDASLIVDILENKHLSIRARGLLAIMVSREQGLTISCSIADAVGDDRVGVYAALRELEDEGYMRTKPDGWEFFLIPAGESKASDE